MTKSRNNFGNKTRSAHPQQGVILLMILIVLVILTLSTLWAVKGSISTEQVGNNLRISTSVNELAEKALRYCENAILAGSPPLIIIPAPAGVAGGNIPTAWTLAANWTSTPPQINTVPQSEVTDALNRWPSVLPVCMVEEMRLPQTDMQRQLAYLITARAFSEDFSRNTSTGQIVAGSDAWVQSNLRF